MFSRSARALWPAAAARGYDRTASPWWKSLNGQWDFRLVARPEDVPAEFVRPEFQPDAEERDIQKLFEPIHDAVRRIHDGAITDSKTVVGILLACSRIGCGT